MKYENVKIGDEFLVSTRYKKGIYKVTKVTPKRFECGGFIWAKSSGYLVGEDTWNSCILQDITEDEKKQFLSDLKKQKLIEKLSKISFRNMSLAKLEAIDELISSIA